MTLATDPVSAAPGSRKSRLRAVNVSRSNRSPMTNRSTLIDGIDGRSAEGRRFRDLVVAYSAELGGYDALPEDSATLVRQAATVTMQADAMQAAIARGEAVDAEQMVRLSNTLSKLLHSLQRRRRPKKAPSLAERLAGKASA